MQLVGIIRIKCFPPSCSLKRRIRWFYCARNTERRADQWMLRAVEAEKNEKEDYRWRTAGERQTNERFTMASISRRWSTIEFLLNTTFHPESCARIRIGTRFHSFPRLCNTRLLPDISLLPIYGTGFLRKIIR